MKKLIILVGMLLGQSAFADRIENLDYLALKCRQDVGFLAVMPRTIELDFFEDKLFLTLDGEEFEYDVILKAGTEGSDPYIQFVANNVVNLIISGPQLTDAFNGRDYYRPYRDGGLFINVNDFRPRRGNFQAKCFGEFGF